MKYQGHRIKVDWPTYNKKGKGKNGRMCVDTYVHTYIIGRGRR